MLLRALLPSFGRALCALATALLSLAAFAPSAGAFSSGSPVCKVDAATMAAGQGTPTGVGTGGFAVGVLRGGNPVTTIVPGETLQIRVSNASNTVQRGILIWVENAAGTSIGSFAPGAGIQLTPGCGSSSATHTSTAAVTVRTVNWTAPANVTGTFKVSAVVVSSSRNDWYGPLTTTVQAAAPAPVPALPTWGLIIAALAMLATAWRRLRTTTA